MDSRSPRDANRPGLARAAGLWSRLEPVRRRVRARVEVDTRSLAAARIALGFVLLVDLVHRSLYLETFYTDSGAYPLRAFELTWTKYNGLSIHALSGDLWFQAVLFVVAGVFALAFMVGYRTRLVGVVSLYLLYSLHGRNPALLNGGDILLRVLLFVALLSPLGERWSIDALRRGSARSTVASAGTVALLVQPVVVFSQNAILKHQGENWYAGEALRVALSNDVMTVFLGDLVVNYPTLLTVLNYGWIVLLSGSAIFLLCTTGWLRAGAALAYIPAFAGMLATMFVGLFPLVLTAAILPFLTTPFWDALAARVPDRWKGWLPGADDLGPLGRPPVERRLLGALRDRGHELAASRVGVAARWSLNVAGTVILVWIVAFAAVEVSVYEPPEPLDNAHVEQQDWGLYAPDPSESYSWYVVAADLENGSTVDALERGPVEFEHPPEASNEYPTFRHRKFMSAVRRSGESGYTDIVADSYAIWACRQATAIYGDDVRAVTVYQMHQPSPIYGDREEPERHVVVTQNCGPVDRQTNASAGTTGTGSGGTDLGTSGCPSGDGPDAAANESACVPSAEPVPSDR